MFADYACFLARHRYSPPLNLNPSASPKRRLSVLLWFAELPLHLTSIHLVVDGQVSLRADRFFLSQIPSLSACPHQTYLASPA